MARPGAMSASYPSWILGKFKRDNFAMISPWWKSIHLPVILGLLDLRHPRLLLLRHPRAPPSPSSSGLTRTHGKGAPSMTTRYAFQRIAKVNEACRRNYHSAGSRRVLCKCTLQLRRGMCPAIVGERRPSSPTTQWPNSEMRVWRGRKHIIEPADSPACAPAALSLIFATL